MARQLSLDETAAPLVPEQPSLPKLRKAAAGCTACDLHKTGTQTVFGEGARSAEAMFVGEQPGDHEDKAGKPFVGPTGRLFDEALVVAGIDRTEVYVTNVVKHFKWVGRGKRRIHQKPNWQEIAALPAVARGRARGRGATCARLPRRDCGPGAARAAVPRHEGAGPAGRLGSSGARAGEGPSGAILRSDPKTREQEYAAFGDDLKAVAELL